jgi:Excalibur calcium-binding domain
VNIRTRVILGTSAAFIAIPAALTSCVPPPPKFATCALMNRQYPHGVGRVGAVDHVSSGKPVLNFTRNNAIYNANTARDRDHDGIACEEH